MNILILGAFPRSIISFRGDLIRELCRVGDVTVSTAEADNQVVENVSVLGASFKPYPVERNGLNPLGDLRTLRALGRLICEPPADLIVAYTIKPVIWGGIASRRNPQARFVALITGLGYAFEGSTWKRRLLTRFVRSLYRFSLKRADAVIFQNKDNRELFVQLGIVPAEKCHVVAGSGVNTDRFTVAASPDGPLQFLLIARLLGEKGIREFVEAARIVKQRYPDVAFQLLGPTDPSPDGISLDQVLRWEQDGSIDYLGETDDVRPYIADCHVYCLPSYHEGMPRTVLEAMSMGRPILTTDVCGCKETVVPGENGWLVPAKDAEALAERMIWFIENRDALQAMGDASRRMVEDRFDVRKVNADMLRIMGLTVETAESASED